MPNLLPLVSVIVPVYNVEKYITDALNSLCTQSYRNLEILLVDDGSTDGSSAICDRFSLSDSRIHVFHLENGGVSAARNYALDHAAGDYCLFFDADDLVKPNYVKDMVFALQHTRLQIATCWFAWGQDETPEEFLAHELPDPPIVQEISIDQFRYTNQYRHYTVSAGLYSRSLIGDLRFDTSLSVGEDLLLFSRLLRKARKFAFIDEIYYYATYREDSATHTAYNPKQLSEVTAWETVVHEAAKESDEFQNECKVALAVRIRNQYDAAFLAHYPDPALFSTLHHKAFRLRKNVFRSKHRRFADKVKFGLFLCTPRLFTHLKLHSKLNN